MALSSDFPGYLRPRRYLSRLLKRSSTVLVLLLATVVMGQAQAQAQSLPSIAETVTGKRAMEGYFDLYWDDSTGKLYWEIDKLDTEFLYQVSMGSGLGSNPIGIDRGQLRGTYLLKAERVGPKVFLKEPNYRYQALSDNCLLYTSDAADE